VAKKEEIQGKQKNGEDEKPKEATVEFLASLAAVLVTGLFIITFVVQAFEIPSSSMENTLLIGDHVFVNRIQFAPKSRWIGPLLPYRDVHFRDIVVFLSPQTQGLFVVKRIIGVPGDRIHLRNGVVYRNGEALTEPYLDTDKDNPSDSYRNEFPSVPADDDPNVWTNWRIDLPSYIKGDDIVVPPGHYFAMGDHRGVSLDSRYWGFIPQENIVGRPMFIYWSFETPDDQYLKTDWSDRALFFGKTVLHFFDGTRWKRTLNFVR
jgi:signal peptidase I